MATKHRRETGRLGPGRQATEIEKRFFEMITAETLPGLIEIERRKQEKRTRVPTKKHRETR